MTRQRALRRPGRKAKIALGPALELFSVMAWRAVAARRRRALAKAGAARQRCPMHPTLHLSPEELEAGLTGICAAPKVSGTLELVVRRPRVNEREVLVGGELDVEQGLVGDSWRHRGSRSMPDGSANPQMQINIMGARVIALLARSRERWALAGDQLYVDLDLSEENLPVGTRLGVGPAVLEITAPPHTGCSKFTERFGLAAMKFVNSPRGRQLRLRGLNARVVKGGAVRMGDPVSKL